MPEKVMVIVDDEEEMVNTVSEYLSNKGFTVKGFADAEALFKFLDSEVPDLILLDLMLPGMNGFDVCKKLKENTRLSSIPIIILSAHGEEPDKISGLELGADDYMVKPFSLNELNARIKAVLRRNDGGEEEEKEIKIGEAITIDLVKHKVTANGEVVELTPTEFKILECLSRRKDQVFTRDQILDYLWGKEKIVVTRTIDVHVRHLREKLGKIGESIKNVRGIGYKFEYEA